MAQFAVVPGPPPRFLEQWERLTEAAGNVVRKTQHLSGFTALASEVIWTRLLSLLLGATVYTFSLILALFLFGLGLGSRV